LRSFTPEYIRSHGDLVGGGLAFVPSHNAPAGTFLPRQIAADWQRVLEPRAPGFTDRGRFILCASIIIGVCRSPARVKITSLILEGRGGLPWPSLLLTALPA